MTKLKPTGPRLDLMRSIAAGNVEFDPDSSQFISYKNGRCAGVVTGRFNDLRREGLARQIRFAHTELTDAGRAWLAEHDKEG